MFAFAKNHVMMRAEVIMMKTYSTTKLRGNIYSIFKQIVQSNQDVAVTMRPTENSQSNEGVVIMSQERYEQLQELEFLRKTGTLDTVLKRMENEVKDDFDMKDAY